MNNNENLSTHELRIKAEGVKECAKWVETMIKTSKGQLIEDKNLDRMFGIFEDCGESYRTGVIRTETQIDSLVGVKIGLEKYSKKLKHMANEKESEYED